MKEFICHVAQKGLYIGPVYAFLNSISEIEKKSADYAAEVKKLDFASDRIKLVLSEQDYSEKNAEVMETVAMMLEDDSFMNEIKQYIQDEKCNAEYAVKIKSEEYAKKMEESESDYLRTRGMDVRGVGEQLIHVMSGKADEKLTGLSALVAYDISPAQLTSFDNTLLGAIITDKGSQNSHLSILAGNMGIPYIYGNPEAVTAAINSKYILIEDEKLILDPDEKTIAEAKARMALNEEKKKQRTELEKDAICKTKIYANIAGPEDLPQLLESEADGVGLFRSEFLFLGKNTAPSEEEQYLAYKSVLEAMGEKEVIIRTMDLGSDKKVEWLSIPKESNPALGLRGARVSLEKKDIFNIQLRALLRAGVYGNLKVMFPMIVSEWEVDEIADCMKSAAMELEKENIPYKIPEVGIMVETPAAALTANQLSKSEHVKFFSIGTNDLTQYTLALDRESQGLDRYFNPNHEAVMQLIEITVKEGHKNGVTTGICGQLAADPNLTERLIAAGVDELSVPISKVRQTRANAAKAEKLLEERNKKEKEKTTTAIALASPADGELIPMEEIPDPVFSSGQVGECVGILPDVGSIWSPCDGRIINIAETKHAVTILSDNGEEILIHVGIDTVKLGGKGFNVFVAEGEYVNKSQKIMEADLGFIHKEGYSTMVIMVKL